MDGICGDSYSQIAGFLDLEDMKNTECVSRILWKDTAPIKERLIKKSVPVMQRFIRRWLGSYRDRLVFLGAKLNFKQWLTYCDPEDIDLGTEILWKIFGSTGLYKEWPMWSVCEIMDVLPSN